MRTKLLIFLFLLTASTEAQTQASISPFGVGTQMVEDQYDADTPSFYTWYVPTDKTEDLVRLTDSTNSGAPLNAYISPHFFVSRSLGVATFALDESAIDYNNIANIPSLGTASTQNSSAFAAASHTHVISDVTGLSSALSAKFDSPSGTTGQYVRGDGSLATFPTNLSAFTNGPGYITGITSGNVTTALGYTPYNATNPNSYVDASGARSSISLTTTGSGAATYNSSTGVINVPTPAVGALIQRTTITTNASGVATWTFPASFSSTPKISLAPIDSNSATSIDVKITSKSTTSVTIQVNKIVPVLGVLTLLTSTNVGATDVDIIAIEP